ncbi:hypothetical protein M9Y10_004203 [Tritrichomonas musculus]|uniref:SUN domain-containing protein n=1 Tax=Tritrichomonas musculus TaxID=1915356 RepID=A0ABR2JRD7_9EUKA
MFKVIIGNDTEMNFPIYPIISFCPNWAQDILNEKKIKLEPIFDLNSVRDFFDGIANDTISITNENCVSISKLALLSGSNEIYEESMKIVNETYSNIPEILNEIINENKNSQNNNNSQKTDHHNKEIYLAQHYNELLKYPELIKNLELSQHLRIIQIALRCHKKDDFDIHGLISFAINCVQEDRKYSILFSPLDPNDFTIDELQQLLTCPNLDKFFLNFKTIDFLTTIKNNKEKIEKQQQEINQLRNIFNDIKQLIIDQQATMNDLIINHIQNINQQLQTNNAAIMSDIQTIKKSISDIKRNQNGTECPKGIFNYLFDKYNLNPVALGMINIRGNSDIQYYRNLLPKIIDPNWEDSHWCSVLSSNSYVKIEFINSLVSIDRYRLLVGTNTGSWYFKSWILKGITEDNREIILDEVDNSNEVTKNHPETTRPVHHDIFLGSIQIIMKGKNSDNDYRMCVRNIELYGFLKYK